MTPSSSFAKPKKKLPIPIGGRNRTSAELRYIWIAGALEHHFLPKLVSTLSAAAAMAIYASIASGMIALTGIVFSLAFVMVQFSATAYSPRLVLWVARDPVVSNALGVFSSTFLYALIDLAWVDRSASGKVPFISGWLVFGLLVASIGMFIALIERIGRLQVNRMLIFTGDQGRNAIEELYPAAVSDAATIEKLEHRELHVTQTLIHTGRPQVVQRIRMTELLKLAKESGAVIEMVAAVGDTVLEMTPLLRVYAARRSLDEDSLTNAIETGDERTFEQDPKYAIRILVDIAIKALSPERSNHCRPGTRPNRGLVDSSGASAPEHWRIPRRPGCAPRCCILSDVG